MKCLYCGEDMEKGLIESSEPINFLKETHFINQLKKRNEEFNLAKAGMGRRAAVEAWLCRDCGKLIIYC